MARVFLSYDREDEAPARAIAQALEKAGHGVWWDQIIKPGAQFGKEIEQALNDSDAVIVLWSERSIDSAWVRDEAAAGRDNGRLVPVLLDKSRPPMGFRQFQNIDLSRWSGRAGSAQLQNLVNAVAATTGQARVPPAATATSTPRRRLDRWWLLVPALGALLLVAGFAFWRLSPGSPAVPLVAVTAADQSPGPRAWARDLLVKLASLQTANSDALRLVDQGSGERPDLVFEVGGSMQPDSPEANLLLRSGKDRAVLWSKDFQQPGTKLADLKQQLAYTAAQVLRCALEGLNGDGEPLSLQMLKLYLNGCSDLASTANPFQLKPLFLKITEKAPKFEGAWGKLLRIETELASIQEGSERKTAQISLKRHIAEARNSNPQIAEAYFAEAELLPKSALFERFRLLDRAVDLDPDNPEVLYQRSIRLLTVGRINDSLADAHRAAEVDPLSPAVRDQYIFVLIYAGNETKVLEELAKVERLWSGASNLELTRWFYHLRYGDPNQALRKLEAEGLDADPSLVLAHKLFLKARIDPSKSNIDRALAQVRAVAQRDSSTLFVLVQNLAAFGRNDELFETLMRPHSPEVARVLREVVFRTHFREFWWHPRSMQVAAKLGLIDYWRRSGKWPDFCADAPYDCRAEAEKLGR